MWYEVVEKQAAADRGASRGSGSQSRSNSSTAGGRRRLRRRGRWYITGEEHPLRCSAAIRKLKLRGDTVYTYISAEGGTEDSGVGEDAEPWELRAQMLDGRPSRFRKDWCSPVHLRRAKFCDPAFLFSGVFPKEAFLWAQEHAQGCSQQR